MTTFTDNFDRAAIGTDWNIAQGSWDLDSNQLRNTTGSGIVAPTTQPATQDQYIEVDLTGAPPTTKVLLLRARQNTLGTQYFAVRYSNSSLSFRYNLGSSEVTLGAAVTIARATPSKLRFEVITVSSTETLLRAFINGALVHEITTTIAPVGDKVAIQLTGTGTNTTLDNFAGGDITGGASPVNNATVVVPAPISVGVSLLASPTASVSIDNEVDPTTDPTVATLTIGGVSVTEIELGTLPITFEVDGVVIWEG